MTLPNYEHEIVSVMSETWHRDDDREREVAQERLFTKLRRPLIKQCKKVLAEAR